MAMSPENGFLVQWSYKEKMEDKQPVEGRVRGDSLERGERESPRLSGSVHSCSMCVRRMESSSGRVDPSRVPLLSIRMQPGYSLSLFYRNPLPLRQPPGTRSCAAVFAQDVDSLHPLWDNPAGVAISASVLREFFRGTV